MTTEEALKMWKKIQLNSLYGIPRTPDFVYMYPAYFQNSFQFANVKTADAITNAGKSFSDKLNPGDVTFTISDWWDQNENKGKQIFNDIDPYGEENW